MIIHFLFLDTLVTIILLNVHYVFACLMSEILVCLISEILGHPLNLLA